MFAQLINDGHEIKGTRREIHLIWGLGPGPGSWVRLAFRGGRSSFLGGGRLGSGLRFARPGFGLAILLPITACVGTVALPLPGG